MTWRLYRHNRFHRWRAGDYCANWTLCYIFSEQLARKLLWRRMKCAIVVCMYSNWTSYRIQMWSRVTSISILFFKKRKKIDVFLFHVFSFIFSCMPHALYRGKQNQQQDEWELCCWNVYRALDYPSADVTRRSVMLLNHIGTKYLLHCIPFVSSKKTPTIQLRNHNIVDRDFIYIGTARQFSYCSIDAIFSD